MGTKECTRDEHQVMGGSIESLYCTPETNRTLALTRIKMKTYKELL